MKKPPSVDIVTLSIINKVSFKQFVKKQDSKQFTISICPNQFFNPPFAQPESEGVSLIGWLMRRESIAAAALINFHSIFMVENLDWILWAALHARVVMWTRISMPSARSRVRSLASRCFYLWLESACMGSGRPTDWQPETDRPAGCLPGLSARRFI